MAQKALSKCNNHNLIKEEKLNELKETFEEIFKNLQYSINKKDLHNLILDETRLLKSEDTLEHQKPEDYTKQIIIRPLFKVLNYEAKNIGGESGQDLDVSKRWADYNLIIKNENVLVEAEPLNKDLRTKKSGIDQVKEWILSKKTKTNFGIATNGFLWIMVKYDENAKIIRKLKTIDLRPIFVDFINQDNKNKEILKDFYSSFSNETIISVFKEISYQLEEYQENISQKFYSEYMDFVLGIDSKTGSSSKRGYSLLTAIKSPDKNDDDSRMFAITFINRIIFIKFLEDKGLVNKNLFKELWNNFFEVQKTIPTSFYKLFLERLFFGVFNTPPKERLDVVKKIKLFEDIPYLNGGLFSKCIPKELEYDIEDDILKKIIIDFIEGYIFTISGEKGLDPDILGYIFEKTINYITKPGTNRQKALGAYYTPDDVTTYIAKNTIHPILMKKIKEDFIAHGWKESELIDYTDLESFLNNPPRNSSDVKRAINVVKNVTILDPACGSGHFLTTALKELMYIKESLLNSIRMDYSCYNVKRETIGNNLFGVDIEGVAVEIAKLRLWLSLIEDLEISNTSHIETLPNIEYNILTGDSLVGWTDELMIQPFLHKPYDEEIQNLFETAEILYKDEEKKLKIILDAKRNFDSYKIDKILESYNLLKSIYPLESFEKAIQLKKIIQKIRKPIYTFIGGSYAQYLDNKIYPKKKRDRKKTRHIVITPEKIKKSFHWGVDFSTIIKEKGFDVVIGNPPYIERNKFPEYLNYLNDILKLYKTENCGNTHAFFYERSFNLLKKGGYCGLIIPVAAISTDRMVPLQEILIKNSSNLWISNYDDRPGKIFRDLEDCRSSIIISEKKENISSSCNLFTTSYNRWRTEDRDQLFSKLNYVCSTEFIRKGAIPKIGEEIEKSILKKIFSNNQLKKYLGCKKDAGKIWYHNAPRYWIRAMDFIPYFWNEREGEKISSQVIEINVYPKKYKEILTASLNSSLFYWFFILYSDGRHLNIRDVENFPISLDKMNKSIYQKLKKINSELMRDYKRHAIKKECTYVTTGKVKYDEFYPGESKTIMDKIDDLLAEHYSFTDGEKEYIKTFSLMFRLGTKE